MAAVFNTAQIAITRPRRFGKTMNLSMLSATGIQHFFSSEVLDRPMVGLFDGLAISKDPASMAHQGQYPVIFFTFKGVKESCFERVEEKLSYLSAASAQARAGCFGSRGRIGWPIRVVVTAPAAGGLSMSRSCA